MHMQSAKVMDSGNSAASIVYNNEHLSNAYQSVK